MVPYPRFSINSWTDLHYFPVPVFSNIDIFLKSIYAKIICFEDVPICFLIFSEVFWYNKSHKYGAPGLGNQEIMKNQELDVWNNEIGILLYQSEAGKSIKPLNLIFESYYYIFGPKNHNNYYGKFPYDFLMIFLWLFFGAHWFPYDIFPHWFSYDFSYWFSLGDFHFMFLT